MAQINMAQINKDLAKMHNVYSTLYSSGEYYYALMGIGGQDSVGRANEQYVINDIGEENIKYASNTMPSIGGADHDADMEIYGEDGSERDAPEAIIATHKIGGNTIYVKENKAEEYLESLENYPLLGDESDHSDMQHEEQLEALSDWAWDEIKEQLLPKEWGYVDSIEDALDLIDMEDVYKILWDNNLSLDEESSGSGYYIEDHGVDYTDLRANFYGFLRDRDMIPDGAEKDFYAWVNDEEPLEESIKTNYRGNRMFYNKKANIESDNFDDKSLRKLIREEVNISLGLNEPQAFQSAIEASKYFDVSEYELDQCEICEKWSVDKQMDSKGNIVGSYKGVNNKTLIECICTDCAKEVDDELENEK